MKMQAVRVSFEGVIAEFDRHHLGSSMYSYSHRVLESANIFFEGLWHHFNVSAETARSQITLMYHHHPFSGFCLVPECGANVVDSASRLRKIAGKYKKSNAFCFNHIEQLKEAPFTPIYLASHTPSGYKVPLWEQIAPPPGNFYHLDGLHRLLAWELAGRLNPNKYDTARPIQAFVAGAI